MKKIIVLVAWAILLLSLASVRAGEFGNGVYLGGKLGVNISSATGANNSPGKGTVAYLVQGGYLQGGYIFESKTLVLGVGSYFDLNPSDKHESGVKYGSRAFGFDTKVGLPLGSWMPYAKLGYGYSTGTNDLKKIASNSINAAFGVEYKIEPQWSLIGEYKRDNFSNNFAATQILNKTITFGINYYFSAPVIVVAPTIVEVEVEDAPAPVVVPKVVEDAPSI